MPRWRLRATSAAVALLLGVTGFSVVGLQTAAWAVPLPYKNCGTATDPIQIQSFDASVWPPQAGKPLTLSYRWLTTVEINKGAYVWDTTTVSGVQRIFRRPFHPLPPTTELPVPPGPYTGETTITIPDQVEGLTFHIHVVLHNRDGSTLACLGFVVPIK
ncbi:MAG: ML domain-containing protein [Nitrososphaerales archaeon]